MARDSVKYIAKFGSVPEWELMAIKDSATDPLNRAKGVRSEAQTLWGVYSETAAAIHANDDYTAEGKSKKYNAAANKALDDLTELRKRLVPVEQALATEIGNAKSTQTSDDRIAGLLEQAEIRRFLEADPTQTQLVYLDALSAGDFATMDAIESAPRLWPGRPKESVLAELQSQRLAVVDPRLGEQIRWLNEAIFDTNDTLDTVARDIRGGEPDNLAAVGE